MENITLVSQFMVNSFKALWAAIGTWGVIGVGIIAPAVLYKISQILKKIFRF